MVVSKLFLDLIVVVDSQSNRCLSYPPWTNESNWSEVFHQGSNLFDQPITPKTSPWWWRWEFTRDTRHNCEMLDLLMVEVVRIN